MVGLGDTKGDQWNDMAKAYNKITVETSHTPIEKMLERSNALLPLSEATGILDNGCGPGPIMSRLLDGYKVPDSCSLTCSDFSEGMVDQVRQAKEAAVKEDSESPWSRVQLMRQDAMDLQNVEDESKSHVTAGWVYFMTPDPQKCLRESKRVLKDGGVLACSSWKESQWLDLMMMLKDIRPDKEMPSMPKEWTSVENIKIELERAGYRDVESHEVATTLSYEERDTFVDFMFSKMPHMVAMMGDVTAEEKVKLLEHVSNEAKKMCPDEPGKLKGTALVAVGRK
ncbi:hypothetical protein LTR37_010713 [Vermiconidia calcicola]|uniref:Uncharacterized protein n=1 Tax=Vermiconidia calcicola TaxID=1690605 RepID=A0ACC3N4J8_9PEZI|nr:hypothetical protein LTR37_010713 [Vermiconidia calcicola]